uniref:Uncharacterized protein n=1 Tax=Anopheles quadriannulatus TaxID=34691 RepID=A0A182X271_ANOQN
MCSILGVDDRPLALFLVLGLFSGAVFGDLVTETVHGLSSEQRIPESAPLVNTEPSISDHVRPTPLAPSSQPSPYLMVAHSDYNNRLFVQQQQPSPSASIDQKRQEHGTTSSFVTSPLLPARKRSTNDIPPPRRTRYTPATTTTSGGDDPNRSFLATIPARHYDSYGEWHHHGGEDDASHWPPPSQQQPYYNSNHGSSSANWNAHGHHHHFQQQQQQHHGNVLAGILDTVALYPPYHNHHHAQQQHGLLGLQLYVLLHPVLMLGAMSFLVCLVNAVVGLVDKVKLPLVRAHQDVDRIGAGGSASTPAAGLRDGRDERILDQLYQFLTVALEHQQQQQSYQQQRNESYVLGRS